jgi:hypothetical protein
MLDPALWYASQRRPVFPCHEWDGEGSKGPYTKNGFKDATTDPELIRYWWRCWPRALIGGPVPAGQLVIDFDPYHGGTREILEAITGPLPDTLTAWSGRGDGGHHLFYVLPAGNLVSSRLPDGIDLRLGGKHYTILPPSRHPLTGRPYWWDWKPVAEMPVALVELLRPPPRRPIIRASSPASAAGLLRAVAGAPEGSRNNTLYWASCRAAESGILDDQVEALLINAAVTAGETETKARRTVASARRIRDAR